REAHHQHRAEREVRRDEQAHAAFARNLIERLRVPARRADDAGDALLERGARVRRRGRRRGEVHRGVETANVGLVAELDPAHLVSGAFEHGHECATDLPLGAEEGELHAAARATSEAFARSTARRKRSSSGPTPEAESRSGGSSTVASSAISSASTASISAKIRSNVRSSVSEISDLPSRLIRLEVDSIDSMIRPFRLSFARSSSPARNVPLAISPICSTQMSTHAARFSSRVPT